MIKKFICIFALSTPLFAQTCPSIEDIKNNNLQGFSVYNSDSGSALSPQQFKRFQQKILRFSMAEWAAEAPEGEAHCYYADKHDEYGSAFLAKNMSGIDNSLNTWQGNSWSMRCTADIKTCLFK